MQLVMEQITHMLRFEVASRGRTRFLLFFCRRKGIDSCTSLAPFFVDNDIFFTSISTSFVHLTRGT